MRYFNKEKALFLIILVSFLHFLGAEDRRSIPLDVFLIVDGSSTFQSVKNEAIAWVSGQLVDRILMEGDNVTIWAAGERAQIIHSGEISASGGGKAEIKEKLASLAADGRSADFSGALGDLAPRLQGVAQNRLSYTMLITASAGALQNALMGNSQAMLKWFRSEKFQRWQAFVLAPDIGRRVSQAAVDYMNSQR